VVVCLELSADDLRMVQLMAQPPHHLLLRYNPECFCLSGTGLPRLSLKRGRRMGAFMEQKRLEWHTDFRPDVLPDTYPTVSKSTIFTLPYYVVPKSINWQVGP